MNCLTLHTLDWTWTVFCMAFHLSTQLAFNESSVQRLGLYGTSNIVNLRRLQMNFITKATPLAPYRIRFKLATLTFTALHTGRRHISLTSCNITNTGGLCAHPVLIIFRPPSLPIILISCFSIFCSRVWNSLPVSIRESQSLPTFRRHLKTFYFQSA